MLHATQVILVLYEAQLIIKSQSFDIKKMFPALLDRMLHCCKQLNTILPFQDVENVKTWFLLNSQLLEHNEMIKIFIKVTLNPRVKVFM